MKPKHYCKKYGLDLNDGQKVPLHDIVEDFITDFMALLEIGKARENLNGYENAIRALRRKYDALCLRTCLEKRDLVKRVWNIAYAKVIAPLREKLFPEEMKARRHEKEERKRQREEYRRFTSFGGGYGNFYDDLFKAFLGSLFGRTEVTNRHFQLLGLERSTATQESVKTSFRKLAHEHHPDKGGDPARFRELVEAKNTCLRVLGA